MDRSVRRPVWGRRSRPSTKTDADAPPAPRMTRRMAMRCAPPGLGDQLKGHDTTGQSTAPNQPPETQHTAIPSAIHSSTDPPTIDLSIPPNHSFVPLRRPQKTCISPSLAYQGCLVSPETHLSPMGEYDRKTAHSASILACRAPSPQGFGCSRRPLN